MAAPRDPDDPVWDRLGAPAGLCRRCRRSLLNETRRGSVFLRCGGAGADDRLPRHPRIPVQECVGFDPQPGPVDGPAGRQAGRA